MKKFIFVIALLVLYMPTFASWNGSSTPWTQGNGTYSNPYRIASGEHLAYLADMVNAGVNNYQGQYFLLDNDISLSNHDWIPIGDANHSFKGYFDGGNHTIDSLMLYLNVNNTTALYGLFGHVENGEISNLTVVLDTRVPSDITTWSILKYNIGGIAGLAKSESFINCHTYGTLLYASHNLNISVRGQSQDRVGGLVCKALDYIYMDNCSNHCSLYSSRAGGLIQILELDSIMESYIIDCKNMGNAEVAYSWGGIICECTGRLNVERCCNFGNATKSSFSLLTNTFQKKNWGGIAGFFDMGSIKYCYNTGNMTTNGNYTTSYTFIGGGIVGYVSSNTTVYGCYNRGNFTIRNSSNSGTSSALYGGIVGGQTGQTTEPVRSCYNAGTMTLDPTSTLTCSFIGCASNCSNSYYKSDCGATTGGTPRSEANMKTAVFVTMLNADSVVYIMDANNVNDGYPIHAWTTFNVYTDSVSEIESNSARLWGHYEGTPSSMGFLLRETNSGNDFTDLHYNFAVSPVVRTVDLSANTAYEFCFYAIKDGTRVCGDTLSFQTLMNDTDTTSGGGASADTVFITVHDTVIVNNYIHDTTVINHFFYDTTYIDNYIHDTTYITNCDSTIFQYIHDTVYISQYDTTIIRYVHDTAYVWLHDTIMIPQEIVYRTLSVTSGNPNQGIAAGSGQFPIGTRVEIAAVPLEGNRFLQWSDGSTQNPRAITLNSDLTMIAIFSYESLNVPVNSSWSLSVETGALLVDGVAGETVRIFDVLGRLLKTYVNSADQIRYIVPASGGYIVQVGNGSAKKITVIR